MILYNKRITKALIRLRGCAGWSAPLLFENLRSQVFSRRGPSRQLAHFSFVASKCTMIPDMLIVNVCQKGHSISYVIVVSKMHSNEAILFLETMFSQNICFQWYHIHKIHAKSPYHRTPVQHCYPVRYLDRYSLFKSLGTK